MKSCNILFAVLAGLASTTANAAAVFWEPTDTNVNYIYTTVSGFSLGMFDVDDFDNAQANPLLLNTAVGADTINFTPSGTDYTATSAVTSSSTTLFNDNQFVLALTDGLSWFEPLSWFELAPGSGIFDISFSNGSVMSIDATPTTVVPVPAAVWLFGSGLIGLVGIARRKTIV